MVVSDSIENHKQPILTIYRLAHGCSFKVLKNLFAVSQSVATETLNQVIRVMVSYHYNKFVYFPRSGKEWRTECKIFIKNYEFPYIGVWDSFHMHITGTPGSTHDARLLHYTTLLCQSENDGVIPNKTIDLGQAGEILLITVGESAFPRLP